MKSAKSDELWRFYNKRDQNFDVTGTDFAVYTANNIYMIKKEILLVEDSSDFRQIVRKIFSTFLPEYNVKSFQGADELYRYMILQSSDDYEGRRPALIILDLKLPNINGVELLKLLRQTPANKVTDWKTIPVVMLSSSDRQEDVNKCYQAGASSYLVKPMDFEDLRKLLETVCFYWLDLNKVTGKISRVAPDASQIDSM